MIERIYGRSSPKYARSLQLLAQNRLGSGDLEAVIMHAEEALRIYRDKTPDHPLIPVLSRDLALALLRAGRVGEALDVLHAVAGMAIPRAEVSQSLNIVQARALSLQDRHGAAAESLGQVASLIDKAKRPVQVDYWLEQAQLAAAAGDADTRRRHAGRIIELLRDADAGLAPEYKLA